MQLGFAKAHHKITPREKCGRGPGQGSSLIFLGPSLIFLKRLKLATSRLARRWALPRPTTKFRPAEKVGMGMTMPTFSSFGVPFNISAMAKGSDFKFGMLLAFAKARHKITPRKKSGVALG